MWILLFIIPVIMVYFLLVYKFTRDDWEPTSSQYEFRGFKSPYDSEVPWPNMRGGVMNAGKLKNLVLPDKSVTASELVHFRTENAIFSTPVIDAQDRVYVGSADHHFYAFDPRTGEVAWKKKVGEIIDSAACIGPDGTVYAVAGDAKIYAFTRDGAVKWTYDALKHRAKQQLSLSTNYWFEANIVMGPDGALYVANDDFFLYKLTPDGKIIWGFRTGFLVWSAAAFSRSGTVYIAGFDNFLYALDMQTGKRQWAADLKGALVSSPAVGDHGLVFQGSFSGKLTAVNGQTGKIIWSLDTGSHIYASPALGPDGVLYIGSTNGIMYALNQSNGQVRWTYYIGDAIRASSSLGPDPEGKVDYLVYFGGGDGRVYALEPDGTLRWAYNTLIRALETDYPNINASIALGNSGLAIASSTGDVIWIPYDAYMRQDLEGFQIGPEDTGKEGVQWHHVTPGGRLVRTPVGKESIEVDPINVLSFRLLHHAGSNLTPAMLIPNEINVEIVPKVGFRVEIQSDENILNIIPLDILPPDLSLTIRIRAKYRLPEGSIQSNDSTFQVKTRATPSKTSFLAKPKDKYKIVHMAVPQPAIIPSLDQIGLASLTIPFSIIESDHKTGRFVAWAVQRFGEVGVPQKRVSLYAFSGMQSRDYFLMDSKNCMFEITSFTLPLDLFRVAGCLQPDGTVAQGGSLVIEKFIGTNSYKILSEMSASSPFTPQMLLGHLRQGGIIQFFKAATSFVPALLRQFTRNIWQLWGLVNHKDKIVGIGTFKLLPLTGSDRGAQAPETVRVEIFKFNTSKLQLIARLSVPEGHDKFETITGILVVDTHTFKALPLNYTNITKYRDLDSSRLEVVLPLPSFIRKYVGAGRFRAHLIVNADPLEKIEF